MKRETIERIVRSALEELVKKIADEIQAQEERDKVTELAAQAGMI